MLAPLSNESQLELGIEAKFAGKLWAFTPVSGGRGFTLGIAEDGSPGYTPIPEYHCEADTYDEMADHADALNTARGIDVREATRIVCSSMAAGKVQQAA